MVVISHLLMKHQAIPSSVPGIDSGIAILSGLFWGPVALYASFGAGSGMRWGMPRTLGEPPKKVSRMAISDCAPWMELYTDIIGYPDYIYMYTYNITGYLLHWHPLAMGSQLELRMAISPRELRRHGCDQRTEHVEDHPRFWTEIYRT